MSTFRELARQWGAGSGPDIFASPLVGGAIDVLATPVEAAARPPISALQWIGDKLSRTDYALGALGRNAIDRYYYGDRSVTPETTARGVIAGLRGQDRRSLMELFQSPRYGEPITPYLRMAELMTPGGGGIPQAMAIHAGEAQRAREASPELAQAVANIDPSNPRSGPAMMATTMTPEGYTRSETAIPPVVSGFAATVATNPFTYVPATWGERLLRKGNELFRKGLSNRGAATDITNALVGAVEADFRPMQNAPRAARVAGAGAVMEPVPPPITETLYRQGAASIEDIMAQARAKGGQAGQEFANALKGLDLKDKNRLVRELSHFERTGEAGPYVKPYLDAIAKWRTNVEVFPGAVRPGVWPVQQTARGGPLVEAMEYHPRSWGETTPTTPGFALKRKAVGQTFEEAAPKHLHPAEAGMIRTQAGAASDYAREAIANLPEELVKPVDVLKGTLTPPDNYSVVAVGEWAGQPGAPIFERVGSAGEAAERVAKGAKLYHVPDEIVDFADRFAKAASKADWDPFTRVYRKFLSLWKPSQLGPRMGYWQRNGVTEQILNYLRSADIFSPRYMDEAAKVMRGRAGTYVTRVGKQHIPYDVIRNEGLVNLRHQGMMSVEGMENVGGITRSPMQRLGRPATWLMDKLGTVYEDYPRMMQLLYELDEGAPMAKAVKMVHDFHINYSKVSPWMQRHGLTAFPFARFPIGATKIVARESIRQPGKIHGIVAAQRAGELLAAERAGESPPPNEYIPAFLREQDPLWLGQGRPGVDRLVPQQNYSPLGQLSETFGYGKGVDPWVTAMGPLGTVIGLASNRNYFKGEDIIKEKDKSLAGLDVPGGERDVFLGMNMDPRIPYAIGALPYSSLLSEVNRLNPAGIFGTTEKPSWAGITKRYPEPPFPTRLASMLLGGRVYESDREMQRRVYVKGLLHQIDELKAQYYQAAGNPDEQGRLRTEMGKIAEMIRNRP